MAARLASVIGTHARSPQAQRLHQPQPDALSADAPGFMICPNLLAPQQRAGFLCRINFLSLSNATGQARLQNEIERGLLTRGASVAGTHACAGKRDHRNPASLASPLACGPVRPEKTLPPRCASCVIAARQGAAPLITSRHHGRVSPKSNFASAPPVLTSTVGVGQTHEVEHENLHGRDRVGSGRRRAGGRHYAGRRPRVWAISMVLPIRVDWGGELQLQHVHPMHGHDKRHRRLLLSKSRLWVHQASLRNQDGAIALGTILGRSSASHR